MSPSRTVWCCAAVMAASVSCSEDGDDSARFSNNAGASGVSAGAGGGVADGPDSTDGGEASNGGTNVGGTSTGGTGAGAAGGTAGTGGAPQSHKYQCTAVATAPTDGIFSLRAFGGVMYAGLFGYGHKSESMLFSYPPWGRVEPGLRDIRESVCAMIEFEGRLYANTENDGYIYRSANGTSWERVHSGGSGLIGCGLEVFLGALYAVSYDFDASNHGRVLRTTDGVTWTTVYDSGNTDLLLRHIVAHEGTIYALGTLDDGQGTLLSSNNGTDWTASNTPTRFFRALSWNGELFLSSTSSHSNGVSGIWQFNGGKPQLVHPVSTAYVTEMSAWDGALWAGTSDGWKEATGSSSLLMSRDGQAWSTACTFPEAAAWGVAPLNDSLYVGTWEYGSHGKLYKVDVVTSGAGGSGGTTGLDCSAISSANPAWELCEADASHCAGVFTDGAGCAAFCAAAGLSCVARFGGEPGCSREPNNPLECDDDNGHQSDWCECG